MNCKTTTSGPVLPVPEVKVRVKKMNFNKENKNYIYIYIHTYDEIQDTILVHIYNIL